MRGVVKNKKWLITVPVLLLLLGGVTFSALRVSNNASANSFDALNEELKAASPGFTPILLQVADGAIGQKDYVYLQESLSVSAGIVSFQLQNTSDETIQITQQLEPAGFDVSDFGGRAQFNTSAGLGVIGYNDEFTSAALFGSEVLVFIRAAHIVDDQTLEELLNSFELQ